MFAHAPMCVHVSVRVCASMYLYMYVCLCVCVWVCELVNAETSHKPDTLPDCCHLVR